MEPVPPFWFKQRQCKAEKQGDMLKVTGPNLRESYLYVRQGDNGQWFAGLRSAADGPDTATAPPESPTEGDAWDAAFELYRNHVIV